MRTVDDPKERSRLCESAAEVYVMGGPAQRHRRGPLEEMPDLWDPSNPCPILVKHLACR